METVSMFGFGFSFIVALLLISIGIAFSLFMIYVPYLVAKSRDVAKDKRVIIIILGWAGVFFGITWVIALILAFIYEPETLQNNKSSIHQSHSYNDYIHQLERLAELKDKGILTEEEFESKKVSILEQIK
ncbi:MAG: SHOCT domain-containing protein [Burkholderiales bacterium]|nr:SHOCT domain-containing protein [Burkholderiales bacterium]